MFGSVTRKNVCRPDAPSESAASSSCGALLLHQRDQRARDKRKCHEHRRQRDPGNREQQLDVVRLQPGPEKALRAEQQHEHQTGNDRADRKRQIDQRDQEGLSAEFEFCDRPGGDQPENQIEPDRQSPRPERQPDRGQRFRVGKRGKIGAGALGEGLREHHHQRQHDEHRRETAMR